LFIVILSFNFFNDVCDLAVFSYSGLSVLISLGFFSLILGEKCQDTRREVI
jgi:type IV secretory pathway VirB6-like protein